MADARDGRVAVPSIAEEVRMNVLRLRVGEFEFMVLSIDLKIIKAVTLG